MPNVSCTAQISVYDLSESLSDTYDMTEFLNQLADNYKREEQDWFDDIYGGLNENTKEFMLKLIQDRT